VRRMSTRARWAVPAAAVAVVGVVIGASAAASAAPPSLPARSVAQLLAEVQAGASRPLGPLSATVQQTANLGLPSLPQVDGLGGGSGLLSALAGTTSISIWYLNQQHIRIARPVPMGERDLRLDGRQLWLWNSKTQTATHVVWRQPLGGKAVTVAPSMVPSIAGQSPLAAARQALRLAGTSTNVTLGPNVTVAGRSAYQISISPKGSGSLVSKILIAIDASRHIPLQVQVFARSSASPVYQIGYTALTFGPPAMSNFTFTPPAGAKVRTVTIPAGLPAGLGTLGPAGLGRLGLGRLGLGRLGLGPLGLATIGQTAIGSTALPQAPFAAPCAAVAGAPAKCSQLRVPPFSPAALQHLRAAFIAQLPKGLTSAQRAAAIRNFEARLAQLQARMPGSAYGIARQRGIVVLPRAVPPSLRQAIAHLPKKMPAAQRAAIIRQLRIAMARRPAFRIPAVRVNGGGFANLRFGASGQGGPTVLGKGWESVIATRANPAVWDAVERLLSDKPVIMVPGVPTPPVSPGGLPQPAPSVSGAASAQALPAGSTQAGGGMGMTLPGIGVATSSVSAGPPSPLPIGPDLGVLRALVKATTPVHGAWGSGRLLQTALLTVLITSKGQILAGAVTPSVLYADALSLSR
jgi:outer membrane lipoprotein-sorting protein